MNLIEKYAQDYKDKALSETSFRFMLRSFAEELVPDIENHYCRFNDGECVCDCFKEAIDKINKNLERLVK